MSDRPASDPTGPRAGTSEALRRVAGEVGPAVVGVGTRWGRGSGLVVARDRVVTNAHNAPEGRVGIVLADGREEHGTVAAADLDRELAVIEVDTGGISPVAPDGAQPRLGDPVIAAANPGGRGLHVTAGFVSAVDRRFRGPRNRRVSGAVEHTAPLVRGSSGGPLLDHDGRLLGINTHRLEGGLYLALPADDELREAVERLGRGEAPARLRLGVAVAPAAASRRLRAAVGLPERDGLLVREVVADGPAAAAGLARGDLLVSAAGVELSAPDDLHGVLADHDPAERLRLQVLRGTEEREVAVSFDGHGGGDRA